MCGIAGVVNYSGYDLQVLKNALIHRGPDEQSIYTDGNLALVHTRLAIQDIQLGKQPLHYDHYSIIFNGEIYNHHDLRQQLKEYSFSTNSDTETLLYLYAKYGVKIFDMLDGMFAFCIYDKKNQKLILARDRAGKKPLYYTKYKDSFVFASELNAIKSLFPLEVDDNAINSYLRTGFFCKPYTPYKNVNQVDAGSYLIVDLHNQAQVLNQYYNIYSHYSNQQAISFPEAVIQTEENLFKSVKNRMLTSDVEVGIFLSGGIDSNLIVAMASQVSNKIKTYTVKFDGHYDESHLAKLTAEKYQTDHTELKLSMNLKTDIETILLRYGQPFMDSSAIPSYYVAKEARKNVGVVLNGDGADELFGGYRRYVPVANNIFRFMRYLKFIKAILPLSNKKQSLYNYFYRLLSMAGKSNLDFYLSATTDVYEDVVHFNKNIILNEMNEFIKQVFENNQLSELSKMLYLDYNLLLYSDLLVKMDIATMANSLEARSPFLSKYMLNFAPTLPDKWKINKFKTKYILRELAKKYLPSQLVNQPKRGFEVPLKNWVNMDLKDKIYDALTPGCYAEKFIERRLIAKILQGNDNISEEKRAKMLWSLFCLEVWHRNERQYNKGIIV